MSFYILPKNNNEFFIDPKNSDESLKPYISCTLYNYYNDIFEQIKTSLSKIEDLSYNTFEEMTKIINPYEFIFSKVPGSKFSVSKIKTKSSLFYDFLEISISLNIFDKFTENINALHITNNSEDTISCCEMLREKFSDIVFHSNNLNEQIVESIANTKFNFLFFESDETNINNYIKNIIQFFLVIIMHQDNDGTTILKINNFFYKPIIEIIYILTSLFEKVYIIKPNSSNITSFDKYIVCKNFILNDNKKHLYKTNYLKLLEFCNNNCQQNIATILNFKVPYFFITKIDDINVIFGQQQLEILNQLISILKNKSRDEKIDAIKKTNIQKSISWCEKYKIPCNKFTDKINIFLTSKEN
jgi:hypothetical protein